MGFVVMKGIGIRMSFLDEQYEEYTNSTKIRVFLNFIEQNFPNDDCPALFRNLTEEDVLSSLKYYISENNVKYQITADNYMSDISKFFTKLSSDYNIKNDLFINKEKYSSMLQASNLIIRELKEGKFKEIASYEEIRRVEKYIKEKLGEISELELIDDVISRTSENNKKTAKYNLFMSMIATKLTIQYGIKNKNIANLKLDDYNNATNELSLNVLKLRLSDDFRELFRIYLNARKVVVEKYNLAIDDLFIKGYGERLRNRNGIADYATLYTALDNALGSSGTEKFSYRRIMELIEKGIDILTISRLTGFSEPNCLRLLEYYNNDILKMDMSKALDLIYNHNDSNEDQKIEMAQSKDYIKCPCCGNLAESASKNWIVVQYENDPEKYLACKECMGIDKKDSL
jgi:hypothetical protein